MMSFGAKFKCVLSKERYMRRYVDVFKEPPLEGSKNYNINVIVVIKLNIAEPNTVMLFIFKTLGMCACVLVKNA